MKRSWNPALWGGFVLALVGIFSYPLLFIRWPLTRDFPWANLLLLAAATVLLIAGLRRAFGRPDAYRGKISGSIVAALSLLFTGIFFFVIFYEARQLPASAGSPKVGDAAPAFTLADSQGHPVALATLLDSPFSSNDWPPSGLPSGKTAGLVLIFYRGYW